MKIPGLRQTRVTYWSGLEMINLIHICCTEYHTMNLSESHILKVISLLDSPDMTRNKSLTKGVSIMKATLAYIYIAKVKKTRISNKRKYELYRSLLHIASANIETDRMTGRVKFAGVIPVLRKTKEAMKTLYSIKLPPMLGISRKSHIRNIICKSELPTKTDSDYMEAFIIRFGRHRYVQQCVSLDVRYTMEEIDIVPKVIKYELFHVPETEWSSFGAYIDPDCLRFYLLYEFHSELGHEANAEAAFIKLIRIATQERFHQCMEYREVALNVLCLCYLEKEDYLRAYICFCRAMSLRPKLAVEQWSTSTAWHLAVLASKLINSFRPQAGCSNHQIIEPLSSSRTQHVRRSKNATITPTLIPPKAELSFQQPSYPQFRRGGYKNATINLTSSSSMRAPRNNQAPEFPTHQRQLIEGNEIPKTYLIYQSDKSMPMVGTQISQQAQTKPTISSSTSRGIDGLLLSESSSQYDSFNKALTLSVTCKTSVLREDIISVQTVRGSKSLPGNVHCHIQISQLQHEFRGMSVDDALSTALSGDSTDQGISPLLRLPICEDDEL